MRISLRMKIRIDEDEDESDNDEDDVLNTAGRRSNGEFSPFIVQKSSG